MKPKPGDALWLMEQIEAFSEEREHFYEPYAEKLCQILKQVRDRVAPDGLVFARAKSLSSFAEKALRKKDKYADPAHQLTDLAGARVVVLTDEEVDRVCALIRHLFVIDEANTDDCTMRLEAQEFGYRGMHFVVQIAPHQKKVCDVDVPDFGGRKAEIQVHTALQNAWAGIGHDRIYKSPFPVPRKFKREGARVAAFLEVGDRDFGQLIQGLDRYAMDHGVALSPEKVVRELVDLSVLRVTSSDNLSRASHALRQAQLARVLHDWDLVILFLDEVALEGVPDVVANRVRLELGQAYCRASAHGQARYDVGRNLLLQIAKPKPEDRPARSLPETHRERELRASAAVALARCACEGPRCAYDPAPLYRLAIQCQPTNPYYLAAFLHYETERLQHTDYVELMRPGLLAAIQTCRDHAEVQIELPQSFFTAGRFCLALALPRYEALKEYAKGVSICLDPKKCVAPEVLDEELELCRRLRQFLSPEAACIERLLVIAQAMKSDPKHADPVVDRFAALAGLPATEESEKWAIPLREVLASIKSNEHWVSWPDRIGLISKRWGQRIRPASEALKELASEPMPSLKKPVLIVAGGADQSVEHRMKEYRDHLLQALLTFEGTICSGGTEQGIPGLVGDVVREARARGNNAQRLIGYLPKDPLPDDATEDGRYDDRIRTANEGFSPMEPLQNWTDILVTETDPADVRLLGINGGNIAASEYHLGLALGASVAVVESSGRAVADLLPDVHWWEARNLLVLPSDRMAVRAHVMVGRGPTILSDEELLEIAKAVHQTFLDEHRYKKGDEAMVPWDYLRDDLQRSNLEQVAYWLQILRAVGWDVRPAPEPLQVPPFEESDPVDIDLMAEMEHGRWIVERLRSGWRYGPKRDVAKKISPYLVPWVELTDGVKQWDRTTVCEIPARLGRAGLEVFPTAGKRKA